MVQTYEKHMKNIDLCRHRCTNWGQGRHFSFSGEPQALPGSDGKNLFTLLSSSFPNKIHFSSQISEWPFLSHLHL